MVQNAAGTIERVSITCNRYAEYLLLLLGLSMTVVFWTLVWIYAMVVAIHVSGVWTATEGSRRRARHPAAKVDTLKQTIDDPEKLNNKISDMRNKEVKLLLFDKYLRVTENQKNNMKSITSFFS